jgi:hypothetical protein
MAIADDFSVAVNGDIRFIGGATNYTVLELHRFLQDLADDASASGNDLIDITSDTPSERSTDNIITLLSTYNIDDDAAEHLFAGSITQASGDTVYSGLQVLGSVNNTNTQLMVIQDNDLYQYTTTPATPFWGDQSTGGYNGNATLSVLMRLMVKSREFGADIDAKKIRVQARHWGDSYDFFNVTLGQGESVAAIGTTPDAQNTTTQGTVTAYSHVTNTEGFQSIDLNNTNGPQDYYAQWTYGANTSSDGLKGIWEFIKDLSGNGTAKTIHNLNGELFLGITHSFAYTAESGNFTESETLVWGTGITYDTLVGGTFLAGDYVTIGALGAAGRVMYDNGSTFMVVALDDTSITISDTEVITEADGVGAVTAAVDTTTPVADNTVSGGSGLLLALDDQGTTGDMYMQLLTGSAPVNTLEVRGLTSTETATAGAPTTRTIPKTFLGSYTGSLIGAYGIGVLPGNLTASDSLEDLTGTAQIPPNNVTFQVTGLVATEDRVLVGPRAAGILEKDQDVLNGALTSPTTIAVVMTTAIPSDTPTAGDIRIQSLIGVFTEQPYLSYTASTYTIASADYSGAQETGAAGNVFIAYIDETPPTLTTAEFTSVYNADRDLFVRVRDGGGTPIKTFEAPATLTESGGSIAAIRTSDA